MSLIFPDFPFIIGHRGVMALYPENSRGSFDAALIDGVYGFELDIQLSRDNIPVIFHDRTLAKLGLPRKKVSSLPLAELQKLRYRFNGQVTNESILTLDELFSLYGGKKKLLLELKVRGGLLTQWSRQILLVRKVVDKIREKNLKDNTAILCFYPQIIKYAKQIAPELSYVLNIDSLRDWRKNKKFVQEVNGICFNFDIINKKLAEDARQTGKTILTYTCNTKEETEKAISYGINGIMTNNCLKIKF